MNISKMIMMTMMMVMMTQKLDHLFSELSSSPSGGSPALSQNRAVGSQLRNGGVAFRTQGNDHGNEDDVGDHDNDGDSDDDDNDEDSGDDDEDDVDPNFLSQSCPASRRARRMEGAQISGKSFKFNQEIKNNLFHIRQELKLIFETINFCRNQFHTTGRPSLFRQGWE